MKTKYHNLLQNLEPFIVSHPNSIQKFNLEYMGVKVRAENCINPLLVSSKRFIDKILKLDELCFGGVGMGMPKWVFFDCAVMPGFVIGFGVNTKILNDKDRVLLGVSDNEFTPLSMYIAIPNIHNGWFGHNLSSINRKMDYDCSGLGLLTKFYALGVGRIKNILGATQWNSAALSLHLKLGPLKILSSYTPAHSNVETICYDCSSLYPQEVVFDKELDQRNIIGEKFLATKSNIQDLQSQIEAGESFLLMKYLKENEYLLMRE
jgi:hypothetical protein